MPAILSRCYAYSALFFFTTSGIAANFFPVDNATLISAMVTANSNAQDDVIDLGGQQFDLVAVHNTTDGNNALPSVTESGFSLTIKNGTINRLSASTFRLLHVAVNGSLILQDLTLSNGVAEELGTGLGLGGALYSRGTLQIDTVTFNNNLATGFNGSFTPGSGFGGAIYLQSGTLSNLVDSTFSANEARGGSAITTLGASAGAGRGGAIFVGGVASVGTIANTIFSSNLATGGDAAAGSTGGGSAGAGQGSAIFSLNRPITTITGSLFTNNIANGGDAPATGTFDAAEGAGTIYLNVATLTTLSSSTFSNNTALGGAGGGSVSNAGGDARGGALALFNATLGSILSSSFENNLASAPGGLAAGSGTDAFGGAIYASGSDIGTINNSSFDNNEARGGFFAPDYDTGIGRGGAISLSANANSASITTISDSSFTNNRATGGDPLNLAMGSGTASAIGLLSSSANRKSTITTIVNTTFSGNIAKNHGAALDLLGPSLLSNLLNATIVLNTSGETNGGSGIYIHDNGEITTLNSTIVANNDDGGTNASQDIFLEPNGNIIAASFNLIGTNSGHNIINGVNNNQVGTDLAPLDPLIGLLQLNGGSTLNHDLLAGSPAINTGLTPGTSFDQRGAGFSRTVGPQTDIGSIETLNCAVDTDLDGVCEPNDNCPNVANPSQLDTDGDTIGDACDVCPFDPDNDVDADMVCGDVDNCPTVTNPTQDNIDLDAQGDACDLCPLDPLNLCVPGGDFDGDGVPDNVDNCPFNPNTLQADHDDDGIGDVCDTCTDEDNDGVGNGNYVSLDCSIPGADNCIFFANPDQLDTDNDGLGNGCDICPAELNTIDDDSDGIPNACDPCPRDEFNTCTNDNDADGVINILDNCPAVANALQADYDSDGIGDACDSCTDIDRDTIGDPGFSNTACGASNVNDNCIFDSNLDQSDSDLDGVGDVCDVCPADPLDGCAIDTDNDGVPDVLDNCPTLLNASQADYDSDGIGDACDTCTDIDRDTIGDPGFTNTTCAASNAIDNCIFDANITQTDTDNDGQGDACDICPFDAFLIDCGSTNDYDNDTILNDVDNCPFVANLLQEDVDNDGIGNACDACPAGNNSADADADGIADACDFCPKDFDNRCFRDDDKSKVVIGGNPFVSPFPPPVVNPVDIEPVNPAEIDEELAPPPVSKPISEDNKTEISAPKNDNDIMSGCSTRDTSPMPMLWTAVLGLWLLRKYKIQNT